MRSQVSMPTPGQDHCRVSARCPRTTGEGVRRAPLEWRADAPTTYNGHRRAMPTPSGAKVGTSPPALCRTTAKAGVYAPRHHDSHPTAVLATVPVFLQTGPQTVPQGVREVRRLRGRRRSPQQCWLPRRSFSDGRGGRSDSSPGYRPGLFAVQGSPLPESAAGVRCFAFAVPCCCPAAMSPDLREGRLFTLFGPTAD